MPAADMLSSHGGALTRTSSAPVSRLARPRELSVSRRQCHHVVTPLRQASDRHIMSLLHSRNPVAVRIVRRGQ